MSLSATLDRLRRVALDLVVERGYAPLERLAPSAGWSQALFDACLAREAEDRLEVLAFLAWRGQGGDELESRAASLRQALESAVPEGGLRVAITLFLIGETEQDLDPMLAAAARIPEGHFLSRVVLGRAVAAWKPGLVRLDGGLRLEPGPDWFEERLVKPALHSPEEAEEALRRRSLEESRSRRLMARSGASPWATWTLVGLNVAAFLVQLALVRRLSGGLSVDPMQAGEAWNLSLELMGGNSGALVFGSGQWWRLASSLFLHAGVAHLGFNMASLFVLGGLLERFAGPWRLLLIYFATGLAASLCSAFFGSSFLSVGASGAIFGLAGSLLALRFKAPADFPALLATRIYSSLARPVAVSLALGILLAFWGGPLRFDNWAHFGGLFMGFSLAYLWPELLRKSKR